MHRLWFRRSHFRRRQTLQGQRRLRAIRLISSHRFITGVIASSGAVRSAFQQTVDVTVYAIDDGSDDGGANALEQEFQTEIDAGRLFILRQENRGAAAARNAGLAAGAGDWVAYLDSDNILEPDHVERLLAAARNSGGEYGLWGLAKQRWS